MHPGRRTSMLAAVASLAAAALAQQPLPLTDVLARFPDDDLPRRLAQLQTPAHAEAVTALAASGPRAHRWLLGRLRLPAHAARDFAAAFEGFGPQSTWALAGLLEMLRSPAWRLPPHPLLARLGGSAKPAVPLLQAQGAGKPVASATIRTNDELIRQLSEAPETDVAAEPLPELERVDAAHAPELLALLGDVARQPDWWRAVQAAIACGDETAVGAAALLAQHCHDDDGTRRAHARSLLLALRCWFAASSLLDIGDAAALPEPVRAREVRRAVLALAAPLLPADPRRPPWLGPPIDVGARLLAGSAAPADRELAALSAALATASWEPEPLQDTTLLRALATGASAGPRGAVLAELALARTTAIAMPMMAESFDVDGGRERLVALAQLDGGVLRTMPAARVHELLFLCEPVRVRQPGATEGAGTDLASSIRQTAAAQRQTRRHGMEARALLVALARRSPATLLTLPDVDARERATLVAVLGAERDLPAELHALVLDHWQPPADNGIPDPMPLSFAPTLLARLRTAEHRPRAIVMLASLTRWQDWADVCEQHADMLAEIAALAEPPQYANVARLLSFGPRSRSVLEHLVLAETAPDALRTAAVKELGNNLDALTPCAAFVFAAMDSAHDEVAASARTLASRVQDGGEELIDRLLRDLAGGNPGHIDRALWALGKLRARSAAPWLRVRLQHVTDHTRVPNAIVLLDIDERDEAGAAALRADLTSADAEVRRKAWHAISFSPGASACFLDDAAARLGTVDDQTDVYRMLKVIRTAAARRPDDSRRVLLELTKEPDSSRAQQALTILQELDKPPPAQR